MDQEQLWYKLHVGIHKNNINEVRRLLESGADPNHLDDGLTPLGDAVRNGTLEMVRLILQMGGDPNVQERHAYDETETVYEGFSPMHFVVRGETKNPNHNLEMLRELIRYDGSVNILGFRKPLIFHATDRFGTAEATINLLLSSGAEPMARDDNGDTALGYKAKNVWAKYDPILMKDLMIFCNSPILSPPEVIAEVNEKYPGILPPECVAKASELYSLRMEPAMRRMEANTGTTVPPGFPETVADYAYGVRAPRYETRHHRMAPAMEALEAHTNRTYGAPPGTYAAPPTIVENVRDYLFPRGPMPGAGRRRRRRTNKRRKTNKRRRTSKK